MTSPAMPDPIHAELEALAADLQARINALMDERMTDLRLPTDDATGECFCPKCGEPDPEVSVEAYERFDEVMCADCAEEAFAADDNADDLRRANSLEPSFRRLG